MNAFFTTGFSPADSLRIARLATDSGLLVLIWIVQRIIYPSFHHVTVTNLEDWHRTYTARISTFVIPLMFLQVALLLAQLVTQPRPSVLVATLLVALAWSSTFFQAVPAHNQIAALAAENQGAPEAISRLVQVNWPRTLLWTGVWCLGLFDLLRR